MKMKFLGKLMVLMAVFAAPAAWASSDSYYAALTVNTANSGMGKVYASTSATEDTTKYDTSASTASDSSGNNNSTITFYGYAFPNFGYKFNGWTKVSGTDSFVPSDAKWSHAFAVSKNVSQDNAAIYSYTANFAEAEIKDIYLCVGDTVQLYFYNGTSKTWLTAVNDEFVTGTNASTKKYASFKRSTGNPLQAFNILVTANGVSGDDTDNLIVMDWQGNTYNYRIHVSAARVLQGGGTVDHTCTSFSTGAWTATGDTASGTTATASGATVTIGAGASGTHTVKMSNADTAKTTGAHGAEYTLKVKVNKQAQALDAMTVLVDEDVVVDPSLFGGAAWSFAKSAAAGTASVPSTSGAAGTGVTVHGVAAGETTVTFETATTVYTVPITVEAKPVVNLTTRFTCVGEDVVIPADWIGGLAWRNATSTASTIASLPATSGEAGTGVTVHGVRPGITLVTFETPTTKYTVHVQVNSKTAVDLGTVQTRVGQDLAITDARITGAWKGAASADTGKVTVDAAQTGAAGAGPTVHGVAETDDAGVAVTFNDAKRIYTVHVQVFDKYRIDAGVKTVVPPPQSGLPSSVDQTNYEAPGVIPVNPAWGSNYTVAIADASVATFEQTDAGLVVHGIPQGRRGDVGVTQDNGAKTTLTVTTDEAIYTYTIYVVSDETHVVHFCEGDKTQIWYNDTTESETWFLLINDQRFELGQRGSGEQMHVTLTAQDDQISYIIATADTVGDPEHGDLVVISDGKKYYTYRMSCSPARVVEVGASTNMVCRTVAINAWRVDYMSDQWGYTNYIDVVCDHNTDETKSHFTTATITGRAIAGETYVLVRDDQHKAEEHNAQGAVYTLKTRVVGCPEIPVQISPGVSADVSWENWSDPEATFTVEITGDDASVYTAEFVEGRDHGDAFVLTISAAETATYAQTATIAVKAGGVTLARYVCSVMPPFVVQEGTTAPGYLYGVNDTPWVSRSSDPSVITVTPTKYNRMYSAEAKFLREGWAELHSTNAYYQAGYYFIRATVFDTHITDVDMTAGSTTNVLVTHNGRFAGDWTWSCDNPNLIDGVTLTPDANDPLKVDVQITAKDGANVKGAVNVTVTSGYHRETIRVYVSPDDGKQKTRVTSAITLVVGMTQNLPAEATGGSAWTAESMNTNLVTVTASGAANEPPAITGVSASAMGVDGSASSQTTVTVEGDNTVYIYTVSVVKPTVTSLDMGVINVGETRTMTISEGLFEGGPVRSITPLDNNLTVECNFDAERQVNVITGKQEGKTTLVVKTDTHIYYMQVTVRKNHIDKHIQLAIGEDGTRTTYSYTFDELKDMIPADLVNYNVTTNGDGSILYQAKNPANYSVLREGNKVTFIPGTYEQKDDSINTVTFLGYVDELEFITELHYWVQVLKADNDERVLQKDGTQGYISYKGTDDVHVDPATGDIILVFTNTQEVGHFTVSSSWNVKMDVLAVGGGGAGGSTARPYLGGGGGGAGGFTLVSNRVLTAGSFGVVVGKGAERSEVLGGSGMQGQQGYPSVLTNGFGYAIASAEGGGGGGALSPFEGGINGQNGGSGGGAAWSSRSAVGLAGGAESGQGYPGGVPEMQNAGGGGGGAGGSGGSTGSAGAGGAGRASDISGEMVMYAVGGAGGHNDRESAAGAAGAGPGYGGEGGSGAAGGAGADGVVIVRIKDIYRNIKVPIPGTENIETDGAEGTKILLQTQMVTPYFVWTDWYENPDPCVAFEYEGKEFRTSTTAKPIKWSDAIESVTGTTSVKCQAGTTLEGNDEKVGVGYYSFTIRLKEGYAWEDGLGTDTYGDTSPKVYRWAVVEDESVTTASINIHKTVEWSTPSNATVNVTTFTSPESSGGKTPEVLFMGTTCTYHYNRLDDDKVIFKSLAAAAETANVHYYVTVGENPSVSTTAKNWRYRSGDIPKGTSQAQIEAQIGTIPYGNYEHSAIREFYTNLYTIATNPALSNKYDYIIMEFDGSRIASEYATGGQNSIPKVDDAVVRTVAEFLKPYYESKSVILVVDLGANEQWGGDTYWVPNSYWRSNTGNSLNATAYQDLIGMFAPAFYLSELAQGHTGYQMCNATKGSYYAYTERYDTQIDYEHVNELEALIRSVVKVKPFNLNFRDKIKDGDSGLTIDTVSILACTNGTGQTASTNPDDWIEVMKWHMDTSNMEWMDHDGKSGIKGGWMQVYAESNLVEAAISNVDFTVWTKLKIGIVDDGRFRTSEDAYYNQSTGKWEKNPNDGTAFAEMTDNLGNALNIEGETETETPWSFNAYNISGTVQGGTAYVQGRNTLRLEVGENGNCVVYYRGYPGYLLTEVIVDDDTEHPVDLSQHPSHYVFSDVKANHTIKIVYQPYLLGAESAPVTNMYDGAVHPYDVTVHFVTNELGQVQQHPETEVRFAPLDRVDDESAWTNAAAFAEIYGTNVAQWVAGEYTDVGDHAFAYRVYVKQPGWGETFEEEGWVQTSHEGSDHSVILPRPLTVRPNNSTLIYSTNDLPHIDFTLNGFLDGEDLAVIGEAPITNGWFVTSTYERGKGMGIYPTWVARMDGTETNALWNGRSDFITPTQISKDDGLYNFGNYYLVTAQNGQAVEKLPIAIGGVEQVPGLDPESPYIDTGVDRVEKIYDGVATNLVIDVTSINPSNDLVMAYGEDYTITYALADPTDPYSLIEVCGAENPPRLHAGTNVVWYLVEPINLMTNVYFAASNYQYVVVNPRTLVLESESQTWKFDDSEHRWNRIHEVTAESDGLAAGDTLTTNTTASITHVETVANDFTYTIAGSCAEGDYVVSKRLGTLAVTPRYMVIDGSDYDPDSYENPEDVPGYHYNSGVKDAKKVYDGIGTNITVKVDVPTDANMFKIYYTTNMTGEVVWSETNPIFTNVVNVAVWFRVEAIGEWAKDYVAVTNFANVVITPRTATVTADDSVTSQNAVNEPIYTATVGGDFAQKDLGHEYELIHWESIVCTNFTELAKTVGVTNNVIFPTGVITQGNYVVTYHPGALTVVENPVIVSLWICDHVDAGSNRVHLAINPTLSVAKTPESLQAFITANEGNFYAVYATQQTNLNKTAGVSVPIAYRVNPTGNAGEQDIAKGWIWFTVPVPDGVDASGLLWRIYWKKAEE